MKSREGQVEQIVGLSGWEFDIGIADCLPSTTLAGNIEVPRVLDRRYFYRVGQ